MVINYIKAFDDNYIWTIEKDDKIIVFDPGEASPVINYLKDKNLDYILLTHKHSDHVGGVAELKNKYGSKVYGPIETKEYNNVNLKDGDEFELLSENFKVILTGGHTKEHISYDNTKVYAAHEYSLDNLKFAKSVISNEDLDKEYEEVKNLRKEDKITLPSTIGIEKKINPFFIAKDLDEFIDFRNKKDNF